MAVCLSLPMALSQTGSPPLTSSFLPRLPLPAPSSLKPVKARPIHAASSKLPRYPPLDRHATAHNRLRFARKLQTLLLSKPRHFLPLRILSRCRRYLGVPPSRPLLPLILRYPSLFRLFHAPSHTSPTLSLLSVSLTPAALANAQSDALLRSRITASLSTKLHRLLMLASPHHRLLLTKLSHIAPDLGLPPDFRSRLCNSFPSRFRTVDTSYGRALELVSWDPTLASPFPPFTPIHHPRPIIDRPPKFKCLKLRKGLNLKRPHRDYIIRFQEMADVSPYTMGEGVPLSPEEMEKRACAAVREVLWMAVEKRTLVDHLTHFRKEMGLPNRLRGMLVRHPEMFYVSIKGQRDSVFLVEAYDDKGKLVVEDELVEAKERLVELVRDGRRMRRAEMKGTDGLEGYRDDNVDEEEEDEGEDDGFGDLFDSGIGDDWEDLDIEVDASEGDGEFWSKIDEAAESSVGAGLETW